MTRVFRYHHVPSQENDLMSNIHRPRTAPLVIACFALACAPVFGAWLWVSVRATSCDPSPMGEAPQPGPALKGLDPVLLTQGKEMRGSPDISVTRDGQRYLFADPANRSLFQKEPERYEIQYRGQCAVMPGARGDSDLFAVYKGRIYVFGTEKCKEEFLDFPNQFTRPRKNVAILVFDGMELLDFAGPAEVFTQAGKGRAFNVYTVAASPEPVSSQGLATVKPRYTLADCPSPDVIVVPGGGGVRTTIKDERVIDWLRRESSKAEITLSVCTGAFVLAKAGLLDGQGATTHWSAIEGLKKAAPKAKVHDDRRFVDNGKVVTAAGVSAGIDAALHVVDRLLGRLAARETARYMEYAWQPAPAKEK
jgi:putative intracellular protease/amidase/YHS domain-containing protein